MLRPAQWANSSCRPLSSRPSRKSQSADFAFGQHFLEGFVTRRDLAGGLEFREACERRNERVVGDDLQAGIRRVTAVEELQGQRVQDREVRDRVIAGEGVAKSKRVIGGQLGHQLVGKIGAVVVNRGLGIDAACFIDGPGIGSVDTVAVIFAGAGRGSGRAVVGFGHNVGLAAEARFDMQTAIIGDADKDASLGFLLVRIDRLLGIEFGETHLDRCQAFAGFGVEVADVFNGVFDVTEFIGEFRLFGVLRIGQRWRDRIDGAVIAAVVPWEF